MKFFKEQLKKSKALKRFVFHKRAKLQEKQYLNLCREAYKIVPSAFGDKGNQDPSKEILVNNFKGPKETKKDRKAVHLFLLDKPGMVGPWFQEEMARSFTVSAFSITRHKIGYCQDVPDIISYSCGVDSDDRLKMPFIPEDFSGWRKKLQKDILTAVEKAHSKKKIDLCFAYGTIWNFERQTLLKLRQMSIPVALWYLDEKHGFLKNQEPLIGAYDLHLSNSIEPMRWYIAKGQACYYFPQAIDPKIYFPKERTRDIDVSFVGAAYGWRLEFIDKLKKNGIPIECFGPGWDNGPVEDIREIFWRSKINLGIGFTGMSKKLTCIKARDFQVPGTKSLYLTTYDPELTISYEIGKEILCYRNIYDCMDLIRYYLENTDEAEAISKAGYLRTINEHTYTNRMTELLKWMGIMER